MVGFPKFYASVRVQLARRQLKTPTTPTTTPLAMLGKIFALSSLLFLLHVVTLVTFVSLKSNCKTEKETSTVLILQNHDGDTRRKCSTRTRGWSQSRLHFFCPLISVLIGTLLNLGDGIPKNDFGVTYLRLVHTTLRIYCNLWQTVALQIIRFFAMQPSPLWQLLQPTTSVNKALCVNGTMLHILVLISSVQIC